MRDSIQLPLFNDSSCCMKVWQPLAQINTNQPSLLEKMDLYNKHFSDIIMKLDYIRRVLNRKVRWSVEPSAEIAWKERDYVEGIESIDTYSIYTSNQLKLADELIEQIDNIVEWI